MTQWEYSRLQIQFIQGEMFERIVFQPTGRHQEQVTGEGIWSAFDGSVSQLGLDGWELVSAFPYSIDDKHGTCGYHLWFKRSVG